MDKFDDLLKSKITKEKEECTLPKSFEDKLEKTLSNLDANSSKEKWNINKKFLSMAAGLAFVLIIGVNGINSLSDGKDKNQTAKLASESAYNVSGSQENRDMITEEFGSSLTAKSRVINEENSIYSITFKVLKDNSKYKNIDNKEDINKIISYINNLELKESEISIGAEWDFVIQINGSINSNIIIKDDLLSVGDNNYEIVNLNKDELINLYNELNYEDTLIKYCPTN